MDYWTRIAGFFRAGLVILGAAVFLSGCGGGVDLPNSPPTSSGSPQEEPERTDLLRPGDNVTIIFSRNPPKNHEERIKDDGTITPPDISQATPVPAAGKTRAELEKDLQERYNKYYRNLTLIVQTESRFFYVDGEVRSPNRHPYAGQMTVTKALAVAGGVTDFAKRTKVQLTRVNGQRITVNYDKALRKPELDPPVYPGDRIYVPRRVI